MKKLFIVLTMIACLAFAGPAMAKTECETEPCTPVTADAIPGVEVNGAIIAPESDGMSGGKAVGNFTVDGEAHATAKDRIEWVEVQDTEPSERYGLYEKQYGHNKGNVYKKPFPSHPYKKTEWVYVGPYYGTHWERQIIAGTGTASGKISATMTADVKVLTNGKQLNGGLSYSAVKSTSELSINANVFAEGADGCLQTAQLTTAGSLGAFAYGRSYSEGPNGSYAEAGGEGLTTVNFSGAEYDSSSNGFLWLPNRAEVDFNSRLSVDQSLLSLSYVSPDGLTAANFAYVGGGSASLELGRDGLFGFGQDNININGITAVGSVAQNGMATNGINAAAYGGSSAFFSGAVGSVDIMGSWCNPTQTAVVGGHAIVGGYNNVTSSPGSLTVTSKQFATATTGNSGLILDR